SQGERTCLRRQARPGHRNGRARRLSAAARHAGRFQALRRQGRSALTGDGTMQIFVTHLITTFWTPIFVMIFLGISVYALWPGNRETFDDAARMPLRED